MYEGQSWVGAVLNSLKFKSREKIKKEELFMPPQETIAEILKY